MSSELDVSEEVVSRPMYSFANMFVAYATYWKTSPFAGIVAAIAVIFGMIGTAKVWDLAGDQDGFTEFCMIISGIVVTFVLILLFIGALMALIGYGERKSKSEL